MGGTVLNIIYINTSQRNLANGTQRISVGQIVSKLLQKQRYLLPCQFLLARLSFVSHLILRNHIKNLFFNDTFVLQVSCVTLIKLLTRNIYVIIMLLLQQIVRQKRFLITDYRVANGIVVHLLLPRGGPNPWMKMTLSSYKGQ